MRIHMEAVHNASPESAAAAVTMKRVKTLTSCNDRVLEGSEEETKAVNGIDLRAAQERKGSARTSNSGSVSVPDWADRRGNAT